MYRHLEYFLFQTRYFVTSAGKVPHQAGAEIGRRDGGDWGVREEMDGSEWAGGE
jgi:hypothetical protein